MQIRDTISVCINRSGCLYGIVNTVTVCVNATSTINIISIINAVTISINT